MDWTLLGFEGAAPHPLFFLALTFDLTISLKWPKWMSVPPWAKVALGALYAAPTVAATCCPFWSATKVLQDINASPWSAWWPPALPAGVLGGLGGWWSGLVPPIGSCPIADVGRRAVPRPTPATRPP